MDSTMAKQFIMTSTNQFGSFLVRQNKDTGIFSVTIRDQDKPRHYHIHKQENGMLYFSSQHTFRSISDLIRHHSKSASGLFTMLTKPCTVPHCITDRDEVTCKEKIAKGQFSEEWKGEWRGEVVTVHKITPGSETSFDLLDKCAFFKSMEHKNHIQFLAVHMNSEPFLVITEHLVNGSLNKYLPTRGKDLKLAELISILEQVAAAMQYLEEQNCIHHNLAAKNVIIKINDEEKFSITCKLRIFPYVHKVNNYGVFHKLPAGTIPIRWSPHEAIVNNQINIKSNVWSFGIITWEIVNYCRSYPYPEISEAGVLEKLKRGYRMPRPLGCPVELYKLMSDCWKGYASSRPTFETLHQRLKDFYSSESFGYEEL
jgi:serine/threonine protein kinase